MDRVKDPRKALSLEDLRKLTGYTGLELAAIRQGRVDCAAACLEGDPSTSDWRIWMRWYEEDVSDLLRSVASMVDEIAVLGSENTAKTLRISELERESARQEASIQHLLDAAVELEKERNELRFMVENDLGHEERK